MKRFFNNGEIKNKYTETERNFNLFPIIDNSFYANIYLFAKKSKNQ